MSPRPDHSIAFAFSLAASLLALTCTSEPKFKSIDDVAECDPESPDFPCLQELFLPLLEQEWPTGSSAAIRVWPNCARAFLTLSNIA